jgi:hypothetical protein
MATLEKCKLKRDLKSALQAMLDARQSNPALISPALCTKLFDVAIRARSDAYQATAVFDYVSETKHATGVPASVGDYAYILNTLARKENAEKSVNLARKYAAAMRKQGLHLDDTCLAAILRVRLTVESSVKYQIESHSGKTKSVGNLVGSILKQDAVSDWLLAQALKAAVEVKDVNNVRAGMARLEGLKRYTTPAYKDALKAMIKHEAMRGNVEGMRTRRSEFHLFFPKDELPQSTLTWMMRGYAQTLHFTHPEITYNPWHLQSVAKHADASNVFKLMDDGISKAMDHFETMRMRGMAQTAQYNTALFVLSQAAALDPRYGMKRSEDLFKQMLKDGVDVDAMTIAMMMRGYARRAFIGPPVEDKVEQVERISGYMKDLDIQPTADVYSELFSACIAIRSNVHRFSRDNIHPRLFDFVEDMRLKRKSV